MTSPLSQEARAELVAKAKAATPGPWAFECGDHSHRYSQVIAESERTIHYKYGSGTAQTANQDERDAAFIAAANPSTILSYEATVQALTEERDAALAALAQPKEGEATPPDLTDEVVEGMARAYRQSRHDGLGLLPSPRSKEDEIGVEREAMRAALRLLPRAPPSPKGQEAEGWKPMDQAPKDGTTILLWDDVHRVAVSGRWHVEPETNTPNCFDPGWADWSADNDAVMWDDGGYGPLLWRHIDLPATSPTRDEAEEEEKR